MKIYDPIYGEFELESVLVELIHSKLVQRLRNIHQAGGCYLVKKKWNVTLFENSIGVMLLIRYLRGSLNEQIAGLLHDVSHTAFSHVIDYVLDNDNEDYHEQIVRQSIFTSKYQIDIETILNHSRYFRTRFSFTMCGSH